MSVLSDTVLLCRIKYITVYTEFLRQRSIMSHSCHQEHGDCGCDRGTERSGCGCGCTRDGGFNCRNCCNPCNLCGCRNNGCNCGCSCCESIARALHNLFTIDCGCNRCGCNRCGCGCNRARECGCGCGRISDGVTAFGEIDVYYARQYALNGCGCCNSCHTCRWTV